MKQPDLGIKISELRREKGLTQEELVEMCNISVRTIQRIESGEVTPRIYTVKTIMAALDYDLKDIVEERSLLNSIADGIKRFLLLEIDMEKPSDFLVRQLNIAWIFGILYFVLGFLEAAVEYYRFEDDMMIVGNVVYIVIKVVVLLAYVFFQRGFILVGGLFKNYLLRIISFILIFTSMLVIGYDIASLFYNSVEREFIIGAEALAYGGIGIVYGISLYRLNRSLGDAARFAGIFELIAACFFVTVILGFIGLIIQIPALLLEIIVLYKAAELIRAKAKDSNLNDQIEI